ncbi:MAG: hypothetical protein KC620_15795, partial [Myxococcales bacterium]|nr:hypothetical protein [Myxococcales bacterium]
VWTADAFFARREAADVMSALLADLDLPSRYAHFAAARAHARWRCLDAESATRHADLYFGGAKTGTDAEMAPFRLLGDDGIQDRRDVLHTALDRVEAALLTSRPVGVVPALPTGLPPAVAARLACRRALLLGGTPDLAGLEVRAAALIAFDEAEMLALRLPAVALAGHALALRLFKVADEQGAAFACAVCAAVAADLAGDVNQRAEYLAAAEAAWAQIVDHHGRRWPAVLSGLGAAFDRLQPPTLGPQSTPRPMRIEADTGNPAAVGPELDASDEPTRGGFWSRVGGWFRPNATRNRSERPESFVVAAKARKPVELSIESKAALFAALGDEPIDLFGQLDGRALPTAVIGPRDLDVGQGLDEWRERLGAADAVRLRLDAASAALAWERFLPEADVLRRCAGATKRVLDGTTDGHLPLLDEEWLDRGDNHLLCVALRARPVTTRTGVAISLVDVDLRSVQGQQSVRETRISQVLRTSESVARAVPRAQLVVLAAESPYGLDPHDQSALRAFGHELSLFVPAVLVLPNLPPVDRDAALIDLRDAIAGPLRTTLPAAYFNLTRKWQSLHGPDAARGGCLSLDPGVPFPAAPHT